MDGVRFHCFQGVWGIFTVSKSVGERKRRTHSSKNKNSTIKERLRGHEAENTNGLLKEEMYL